MKHRSTLSRSVIRHTLETAEVLSSDGWLKTGGLGWLDDEGYLYLCGRAKNLIVTAGGYQAEEGEEVEALVYPADELYKKLNMTRGTSEGDAAVQKEIDAIIETVNKKLLPYQRITKTTYLSEPLEMTTTKKVKRFKK